MANDVIRGSPSGGDEGEPWRRSDAFVGVARLARQRDTESLIVWLGALALDPANAVPQLVLEASAHVVIAAGPSHGRPAASSADLRRLTARGFRLFPVALDPPEQPFAAPFLFRATSVVVPMGLVVGAAYDLGRTLEVVDELAERDPAIEALARTCEVVLRVLGAVASRAGLTGVVEPTGRHDRVAGVSPERASRLREAVQLAPNDLVALGGEEWRTLMEPLTAATSPEEIVWNGHDGTLSFRPFLPASDGGLLLAVPGMVLSAIDRYLRSVISGQPAGNGARLREQVLWADIERSLSLLRIRRERAESGAQDKALGDHRVFRIDEVQLLAVVLVTESGGDADTAVAEARDDLVARRGEHVLAVLFAPEAGENAFFGLDEPPAGIAELLMKPEELSAFARVEAGEPRSLADFARASSTIRDEVRVFSWGALDEFAIYRQHQSSYYLSDDSRPTLSQRNWRSSSEDPSVAA